VRRRVGWCWTPEITGTTAAGLVSLTPVSLTLLCSIGTNANLLTPHDGAQEPRCRCSSTPATLAAKRGTTEIPIVMVGIGQPEAVVSNLGRPGRNITGSTILGAEAAPKRLELMRQLLPGAKRVALLWNPDNPANVFLEREVRRTAPKLDISLISVTVRDRAQMDSAFGLIAKERAEALIVTGDPMHQLHIDRVITFAARNRVPAIYNIKGNVLAGGLMSYGADHRELYRRAALYVDRILKGRNK
jgi:putative ABC transport system substrate-binding protein